MHFVLFNGDQTELMFACIVRIEMFVIIMDHVNIKAHSKLNPKP